MNLKLQRIVINSIQFKNNEFKITITTKKNKMILTRNDSKETKYLKQLICSLHNANFKNKK